MFFVIGLGNPERRYVGTRHNVGFEVVDSIALELRISFKAGRGEYQIAFGSFQEKEFALVKPTTYMNQSGVAITEIQEEFGPTPDQLFVVCDDFQLPLGQLRIRLRGSDGGHNGLYSVIYHLQSEEFPRLRCGIGSAEMPTDKNLMAEFVLERFTNREQPIVDEMIVRSRDACLLSVSEGLEATMNKFNKRLQSEVDTPKP
jgi:peptidyl-tRNA hydrolase, PTH1 family